MKQLSISELKQLKVHELKELLPVEVTADGFVIGVFAKPDVALSQVKTKCPNCKMVYNIEKPDGAPYFFSVNR